MTVKHRTSRPIGTDDLVAVTLRLPIVRRAPFPALRMITRCPGIYWPGLKADVHGFRSTLSTWATEQGYPSELAEMALSHAVGDAVERAYQRSTRVNARRELMKAWADFATASALLGRA